MTTALEQVEGLLADRWHDLAECSWRGWIDLRKELASWRRFAKALQDPDLVALLDSAIEQVQAQIDLGIEQEYQGRVQRLGREVAA